MRNVVAVGLLVAMALAGCAEDAGPTTAPDQGTLVDEELVATDDTGVIRGVVVDQSIVPVAGVNIVLIGQQMNATTKDDGSFGFSDLDPGTYFLQASRLGYDGVQVSADVVAGVTLPPITRIQMTQNASHMPFTSASQFSGNLRCGLATPAISFGCSVVRGTEDEVGEHNGEEKHLNPLPDWLQVEMTWKSTQPAGESLLLAIRHCCDNDSLGGPKGRVNGPSPQIAWVTKETILGHSSGAVLNDGFELSAFPSGLEAIRDNTGQNLGVIIDQPFEWFTTEFYNFIPNEGWSFISDGAHPIPT